MSRLLRSVLPLVLSLGTGPKTQEELLGQLFGRDVWLGTRSQPDLTDPRSVTSPLVVLRGFPSIGRCLSARTNSSPDNQRKPEDLHGKAGLSFPELSLLSAVLFWVSFRHSHQPLVPPFCHRTRVGVPCCALCLASIFVPVVLWCLVPCALCALCALLYLVRFPCRGFAVS